MKSIKRGRGPSFMGGVGAIFAAVFGVIWIIGASALTKGAGVIGVIFPLFGFIFVGFAVVNAIYDFKNATSKNRYSEYDIVEDGEETDTLNERFGEAEFCPYCGMKINENFEYCPKCGRKLPEVSE